MTSNSTRIHILLPNQVVAAIDWKRGDTPRSLWITEVYIEALGDQSLLSYVRTPGPPTKVQQLLAGLWILGISDRDVGKRLGIRQRDVKQFFSG